MNKVYLTTAIPYMNGAPHIGHAMDYLLADVAARYFRLNGDDVRLQAGSDEHGGKIWQKALDLGEPVQGYVDENVETFKDFIAKLGVSYTDYVRTTDALHMERCQKIWRKLEDHIYLSSYEGWYCAGCERFVTDKEYEENGGVCPDHQKPYQKLSEQNYYLRISDFKEQIKEAILTDKMLILPEFRKNEILKLLEDTPDVSISRPVTQLKWGVPVPGDESQVMYVWIDALSNYLTVLGYPDEDLDGWWPPRAQFVGKDILRFHAIIWPAMLLGLGLELPKTVVSHGMILSNGQKMSKSVGNIVDPVEVLEKHGLDAFRYFFLRHIDTFADSDFTWEKFEDAYNNELANDLGNLVQRLATLASKNKIKARDDKIEFSDKYVELMNSFNFSDAFNYVWGRVQNINKKIDEEKPWMLAKSGETDKLKECLEGLIFDLLCVCKELSPFIPETVDKIYEIFAGNIVPPVVPLFPKNC